MGDDYLVTWQEFDELVRNVAQQIVDKKANPQSILALGRGSYPFATMLSHLLGDLPIEPVKVSSYKGRVKGKVKYAPFDFHLPAPIILDDLVDTGEQMNTCLDALQSHGKKCLTAVLFKKDCSILEPDFYARSVPRDKWLTFAWEVK